MEKHIKRASKFLSLLLRHKPETIDLPLDPQGWAWVDDLISRSKGNTVVFTRPLIEEIVTTDDKQRYSLSEDGKKIRANQGHSLNVDLQLQSLTPPEYLYHGTATRFSESIWQHGLQKGNRLHVHLSESKETAIKVGQRHGRPLLLQVCTEAMLEQGHRFYRSENGVWLTEHVPVEFLQKLQDES